MMMQSQESPQSSQSQSMESLSQAQLSSQSIQVPQSQESMLSQQESQQPMQSLDHGAAEAANNDHPDLTKSKDIISKASRVCKPGPPLASTKRLPNCLLIGDSITLGYSSKFTFRFWIAHPIFNPTYGFSAKMLQVFNIVDRRGFQWRRGSQFISLSEAIPVIFKIYYMVKIENKQLLIWKVNYWGHFF